MTLLWSNISEEEGQTNSISKRAPTVRPGRMVPSPMKPSRLDYVLLSTNETLEFIPSFQMSIALLT